MLSAGRPRSITWRAAGARSMGTRQEQHAAQVFDGLEMAAGLAHAGAPGIDPVAAHHHRRHRRIARREHPAAELLHVLAVGDHRQVALAEMGGGAGEGLLHLDALHADHRLGTEAERHRVRRMAMAHRAAADRLVEAEMEHRLVRRLAAIGRQRTGVRPDADEVDRLELALVDPGWAHRHQQGLALEAGADVPGRAGHEPQ